MSKYIVEKLLENEPNTPIYYWGKKSYSSRFYSSGDIKIIKEASIDSISNSNDNFIMLISHNKIKNVPEEFLEKMVRIDSIKSTSAFKFEK